MAILDGGADTCVIGKGWTVLAEHPTRRANVVGFDKDIAVKGNLAIVSAICALQLPNGDTTYLVIHEAIYNPTADHSLLSDFQLREYGTQIDALAARHGGKQQIQLRDGTIIPLTLKGCMIHFQQRSLTETCLLYTSPSPRDRG